MKPILSVIIPIYKVENYLEKCVLSVLNQDYKEIEVVLVDDGSPDRCPEICDDLASKDQRIKVIHKINGGLSSARNAGIEIAEGKYVTFLDSDDQWNEGQLGHLMDIVCKSSTSLIMFLAANKQEDGSYVMRSDNIELHGKYKVFDKIELYKALIQNGNFQESACLKILNTEFLRNNNLYFKMGIIAEDTEWFFRVMRIVKEVTVTSIPLFHNNAGRPGSITNTASTKSIVDVLNYIQDSIDYYKSNQTADTKYFELAQCSYLWAISLGIYNNIPQIDKKSTKELLNSIAPQLDLSSHPRSKIVGHLYRLLGFELTTRVLSIYIRLHKKQFHKRKQTRWIEN